MCSSQDKRVWNQRSATPELISLFVVTQCSEVREFGNISLFPIENMVCETKFTQDTQNWTELESAG